MLVSFVLNGRQVERKTDPAARAVDILRTGFGLTGVKEGCGEGECGACSVILDGKLVNSCLLCACQLHGTRVLTIEGFRGTEGFLVIQAAFEESGAVQCGFCTPGFVMAAAALLSANPSPSDAEIREAIAGNLCRCTGYDAIVAGIRAAAKLLAQRGTYLALSDTARADSPDDTSAAGDGAAYGQAMSWSGAAGPSSGASAAGIGGGSSAESAAAPRRARESGENLIPRGLAEALRMRSETGGLPLAGGTDLLVRYRGPAETPAALPGAILSIGRVPELRVIAESGGTLRIGSCVTLSELLDHPLVPAALKEAVREMAGPGIRNSATIGGNVCNASPAGDTLPFLYAVDAELRLASINGERVVPIHGFITGPGRTTLGSDEILTEIRVPRIDIRFHRYRKVGTRRANALSKISFLGLALRDGDIRIAFGACAPVTVRNRAAEEFLRESLSGGCHEIDQAVRLLYGPLLSPIDDQRSTSRYRKETALRIVSAFARELCQGGTQ